MPFCKRKPGAQLARRDQEVILAQLNVFASLEKGFVSPFSGGHLWPRFRELDRGRQQGQWRRGVLKAWWAAAEK